MPNSYAATNQKKFLDAEGLTYFSRKLNQFPTNEVIEAVIEGTQDALDEKVDLTSVGVAGGVASLGEDGKVPSSQLPAANQNITYTLEQDSSDGHIISLVPSTGSAMSVTIPDNNTTYSDATTSSAGLMSATDKEKLDGIATGATANVGTITEIQLNGTSKGTSGTVNLVLAKSDVGLNNVDNTSDVDKPISTATQAALDGKLSSSLKGAASGLAELDEYGKVPSSQLPSYVDDVLEFSTKDNFPLTGDTGKIYIDLSDNKTYRWSGSNYVEISASLALGETASTAYPGDKGAAAYTHSVTNKGSAFSSGLYKITTNAEGHVTAAAAVAASDITSLGIPAQNTTYTLTQDASDGHILTFTPSSGEATTITIPDNNTTYQVISDDEIDEICV